MARLKAMNVFVKLAVRKGFAPFVGRLTARGGVTAAVMATTACAGAPERRAELNPAPTAVERSADISAYARGAPRHAPLEVAGGAPRLPLARAAEKGGFVDLGVGAARVCGLRDDGTAICFSAGQDSSAPTLLPQQGIRKLVLGEGPTCVLLDDETAQCDVPLPDLGIVKSLAMGRDEHCAASANGALRCWEANRPETVHLVPISDRVVQVDAAFSHTCAVTASGDLFCWGDNGAGQLGTPSPPGPARSSSPLLVSGVGRVVEVATGGDHTCARDGGGRVRCWGAGYYGQGGDGTADAREISPVLVIGVEATRLVAGGHHSCALTRTGETLCWGWNLWGQMGEPRTDIRAPAPVAGFPRVGKIGAHGAVTCALDLRGRIACLGGYRPDHFGPFRHPAP